MSTRMTPPCSTLLVNSANKKTLIRNHQHNLSGLKVSDEYPGIFEWDEATPSSVEVWNWRPSNPTGLGCGIMNVGKAETMNGMWTDVDCSAASYYAICEKPHA